jgi:hypothetical protein
VAKNHVTFAIVSAACPGVLLTRSRPYQLLAYHNEAGLTRWHDC